MPHLLYDIWAIDRSDTSRRFRVEYRLSVEGVDNVIPRLRRIYLPEHYCLCMKLAQTDVQERLETEYDNSLSAVSDK